MTCICGWPWFHLEAQDEPGAIAFTRDNVIIYYGQLVCAGCGETPLETPRDSEVPQPMRLRVVE